MSGALSPFGSNLFAHCTVVDRWIDSVCLPSVYRGASGMKLPDQLERPNKFGGRVGIEFAFMSTTTNKEVAIKYSEDLDAERGLSYVMEFEMDR